MKKYIITNIKTDLGFYITTLILFSVAVLDPFKTTLISYLENSIVTISDSIEILFDLKSVSQAGSSSKLIFISGLSDNISDALASSIQYLTWSDMLITAQLLIVKIFGSIYIKVVTGIFLIGTFIMSYKKICSKILIILLLLNPGLPCFVMTVKYIASQTKFTQGSELTKELKQIHAVYQKKELQYSQYKTKRNESQLSHAKKEGHDGVNIFTKLEDKGEDDLHQVIDKVEEGIHELVVVLKEATKSIILKTIHIFSSMVLQFLVLPFLFFFGIKSLFNRFINSNMSQKTISNILVLESVFVIAICLSTFISCGNSKNDTLQKTIRTTETKKMHHKIVEKQTTEEVFGVDVSHFQGNIDWEEIKNANISFAYTKATQGGTFTDPKFHHNWKNMALANMPKGAYHFYESNHGGKHQAEHFLSVIGKYEKSDIPPVLDLEHGGLKGKVDAKELQKEIHIWLQTVEDKLGVKPIIYTNNPFANTYLKDSDFSNYHLWIAEYGVDKPRIPIAWKNKPWLIWQRSPKGTIEGEIGNVDHDVSRATIHKLMDVN